MSILIIGEKPNVGKAISTVVGADKVQKGNIEGNGYIVSWCVGHVVGLKFQDPVERAREMVKKLRPGCDVVIGLMHLGLNEHSEFTSERIAREAAAAMQALYEEQERSGRGAQHSRPGSGQ